MKIATLWYILCIIIVINTKDGFSIGLDDSSRGCHDYSSKLTHHQILYGIVNMKELLWIILIPVMEKRLDKDLIFMEKYICMWILLNMYLLLLHLQHFYFFDIGLKGGFLVCNHQKYGKVSWIISFNMMKRNNIRYEIGIFLF